jgi:signal transduction histidine kinase
MTCPYADDMAEELARARDLIAALRQVNEDQREEIAEQRERIAKMEFESGVHFETVRALMLRLGDRA